MIKYLVMLPNNLGDVIMVLPVLEALKQDKRAYITFFVEEGFEGGVLNNPQYDELLLFPRKKIKMQLRSEQWREGIEQLSAFVKRLQEQRFDVIINLCQHGYVAFIIGLLETETVLGRHFLRDGCHAISDLWSRYLYAIPFSRQSNQLHAIDVYKYIAGVNGINSRGIITISDDEIQNASTVLRKMGRPDGTTTVVLHPGAAYGSKMWPVENYISLAKKLIEKGVWIVITGSESEADIALCISDNVSTNCVTTSGKLTFRESMAITAVADICITGDTAMMHVASALNKKVYALFGPTSPVETGPYGEGHVVFAGRCSSRPCFCFECKTGMCMKSINPETVYGMITTGNVISSSCDIYTTTIGTDATYHLKPLIENGDPYVNVVHADIIRKAFDPEFILSFDNEEVYARIEVECKGIVNMIHSMELELQSYLHTTDLKHIQVYEHLRSELGNKKGMAEFITAVLNVGFNSIPIINPVYAIRQSVLVCQSVRSLFDGVTQRAM